MKVAWIAVNGEVGLHFTNYKAGWGSPRHSTGFVESLLNEGARKFLNVGWSPDNDFGLLRRLFQHHGSRCNKRRVNGNVSIPAVVVFDIGGLSVQQGDDHDLHLQVNVPIPAERVLGWFAFDETITDAEFCHRIRLIKGG